jgi:glyoxylase-like metal-dependent hydrolase (beta-lactamase superfamily II)
MRRSFCALAAAFGLTACTQLPPEQQTVQDAAEAMGGRDKILAVKSLVLEGEGANGNPGQDLTPEATSQTFTLTAYRRAIDVAGNRARTEQTRTPTFTYFQGPAPQKQVQGIDKTVAYNVAANGTAARLPETTGSDRRAEFYHHPLTAVRAALDPAAKLTNPRTADGQQVVDVLTPNGVNLTLAIDGTTKLPAKVVSMAYNANLGDVAVETTFADYAEAGGLKLPAKTTTTVDRVMTSDLRVTKQTVDGDVGDLAAPAAVAGAPAITTPPPVVINVEELAKGVWILNGQSHHSVAIELDDHIMLVEAPNEPRALAVIAKARELRPGKPVTEVVMTHHHFDHSGGIRAAVSEGLAIVTDRGNSAFTQSIATRPHTLAPDALARSPKPLTLKAVDDELVIKDKMRTVALYRVTNTGHSDTMLVVHLPKERILIEADLYTPGAAANLYATSLFENVNRRKLRVDRIASIHGPVGKYDDFLRSIGQKK